MTHLQLNRIVKRLRDLLRTDPGVDGDAHRLAQISWMLFFKAASQEKLIGKLWPSHAFAWDEYRDKFSFNRDGIVAFTNDALLPSLKNEASLGSQSLQEVIGDFRNYVTSDEVLGELLDTIDRLPIDISDDRHLIGDFYENMLAALQSAGNAGEFYTPRALTRLMTEVVRPQAGESITDPASGTGGFLISALQFFNSHTESGIEKPLILTGKEKKALPHLLCATNLLLHGHKDLTHLHRANVLVDHKLRISEEERFDIIMTNPPFGGEEEPGVEFNFPLGYRTKETSLLFMLYAIACLKTGGRGAIIMPDGFLFATGIAAKVRQKLLTDCNVHTILRLPSGVFAPYTGIKSNILFFEKGKKTKGVWFLQHKISNGAKVYSKTRPVTFDELKYVVEWCHSGSERVAIEGSTYVPYEDIESSAWSLDRKTDPREKFRLSSASALYRETMENIQSCCAALQAKLEEWADKTEDVKLFREMLPYLCRTPKGVNAVERTVLAMGMSGILTHSRPKSRTKRVQRNMPANDISELPEGWRREELGALARIVGGATPRSDDPNNFAAQGEGVPWLTPSDLRGNRSKYIEVGRRNLTNEGYSSCSAEILPIGSVIFSSRAPIGYVAINRAQLCTNQGFKSLILFDQKYSDFLYYYLRYKAPEIDRNASGTTFKEVSGAKMKKIVVTLPSDNEIALLTHRLDELQFEMDRLFDAATLAQNIFSEICDGL